MPDQPNLFDLIQFNADGLVPAIVQDSASGEVLMMAWMDKPAVERTLATGQTWFYSRSRKSSWHKGGTSGHVQQVVSMRVDCDGDTLLIQVRQTGGACHNGYYSCFYRELGEEQKWREVTTPVFQPESVYQK